MPIRKVLIISCLLITLGSLSAGFGLGGQWLGAGITLVPVLVLFFSPKISAAWVPSLCLGSLVVLAADGAFQGASPFLMILGAAAGLASWDLLNLQHSIDSSSTPDTLGKLERRHIRALGMALVVGLSLAGIGQLFTLKLPFLALLLLVVIDLFSLYRVSQYVEKRHAK